MIDSGALPQLLQWRLGLADAQTEPLAPEEIRDWLWLAAQLEGAPLPQRYARSGDAGRSALEAKHPEGSAGPPSDDPRPLPPPPTPDRAAPGAYQERSPLGVLICAPQQVYSGWSIKGCEIGRWRSSRSGQRRRMERPAHGRGLGF